MSTKTQGSSRAAAGQMAGRAQRPVPFDPAALEGPLWLREPQPGELSAAGTKAADGDAVDAADVGDAVEPTAVEDVRESAMQAVVGIDEAIASLQAMRVHFLAGLGRLAIDEAIEAKRPPASRSATSPASSACGSGAATAPSKPRCRRPWRPLSAGRPRCAPGARRRSAAATST